MASGDLFYSHEAVGTLSGAQASALGTLVAALWPGALADLQGVSFWREADGVHYSLRGTRAVAPASLPIPSTVTGRVP